MKLGQVHDCNFTTAASGFCAALMLLSGIAFAQTDTSEPVTWSSGEQMSSPKHHAESTSEIMKRAKAFDAAHTTRPLRMKREKENEERKEEIRNHPNSPNVDRWPPEPATPKTGNTDGPQLRSTGPLTPQTIGTGFTGATLADTAAYPPDTMGAVGPTQFIVAVNGRIRTFNKTTGVADGVINADTDVFYGQPGYPSTFTSDPHIRYDRLSGRWFIVIINVPEPAEANNSILIAVSDAASSTTVTAGTVWSTFAIPISSTSPAISTACLADYPTPGIDANAMYIGTNNFCPSYSGSDGYVVRKSSIMGAGPAVVTVFRALVPATGTGEGPYTPQGVDNFDPAATEGYFIGVSNAFYGELVIRRVSNPGGTPTISSNVLLTVPTTGAPITVPHLGNTGGAAGNLDGLDDRLFAAVMRNGHIWTAHNIGTNNTGTVSGSANRNSSRWYEIQNVATGQTPALVQSGTVFAGGTNNNAQRSYWIPSIMVSGQGHAAMGFSVAGSAERINAATVGRLASDTLGSMQTPVLFTNSTTAYNPRDSSNAPINRWGDYSFVSVDPTDDMTMWTIQEFCSGTNVYGAQAVKLIAPPPATPAVCSPATVLAGVASTTVTVTGTSASGSGFYDPGAGFSKRFAASVSGSGVVVNSVTYQNPTSFQMNINTIGAAPAARTVSVTNPDGQATTSGLAILTIAGVPVSVSGVHLD